MQCSVGQRLKYKSGLSAILLFLPLLSFEPLTFMGLDHKHYSLAHLEKGKTPNLQPGSSSSITYYFFSRSIEPSNPT